MVAAWRQENRTYVSDGGCNWKKVLSKVGGQRSDWETSNSQARMVKKQVYISDCMCCRYAHSPT